MKYKTICLSRFCNLYEFITCLHVHMLVFSTPLCPPKLAIMKKYITLHYIQEFQYLPYYLVHKIILKLFPSYYQAIIS